MKFKFLLLGLTACLLTSCTFTTLEYIPFTSYIEVIDTTYSFDTYESLALDYRDPTSKEYEISELSTLVASTNNGNTYNTIASKGEVNILVIPISFTDSDKDDLDNKMIYLQNAFFGDPSKNLNESLTSFYNKSSYGNLIIKGNISDFYEIDVSSSELKSMYNSALNSSRYVLDKALTWYKETYDDIEDYDNDGDGYIDCIYLVYDHEYDYTSNSLYWSYTDRVNRNAYVTDTLINSSEPYASTYVWMSLDFVISSNNLADSHIINHEFGHVLGLSDYYNSGTYQPLGYSDIMDANLGDHNAYSKMSLKWITPDVIYEEGTYTLSTFYDSGQTLLIPAGDYNNTIFDEFILIEYYAPAGVNYKDTLYDYTYHKSNGDESIISLFSQYGIKIYHVDARVAYVKNKGLNNVIGFVDDEDIVETMEAYRDECDETGAVFTYCLDYGATNDSSSHPFIQLLEASGNNSFKTGNTISNSTLFKKGDTFNVTTFTDFTFYNGASLDYEIYIDNLTSEEATITIVKK